MSDDTRQIDSAQQEAEEAILAQIMAAISKDSYLALWVDPETGMLEFENDHLRPGVLLEMQEDEPRVFAIYKMTGGHWSFVSGSEGVNHALLLAEFIALQEVAALHSAHPARRFARLAKSSQVAA
jgi:hypothetical protein